MNNNNNYTNQHIDENNTYFYFDSTKVLDDITGLEQLEISALVAEVLNNNRPATSTLGYRTPVEDVSKQRNVSA